MKLLIKKIKVCKLSCVLPVFTYNIRCFGLHISKFNFRWEFIRFATIYLRYLFGLEITQSPLFCDTFSFDLSLNF